MKIRSVMRALCGVCLAWACSAGLVHAQGEKYPTSGTIRSVDNFVHGVPGVHRGRYVTIEVDVTAPAGASPYAAFAVQDPRAIQTALGWGKYTALEITSPGSDAVSSHHCPPAANGARFFVLSVDGQWVCAQIEYGMELARGTVDHVKYVPYEPPNPFVLMATHQHYLIRITRDALYSQIRQFPNSYDVFDPALMRIVRGWSPEDKIDVTTIDFDHPCPASSVQNGNDDRIIHNLTKNQWVCGSAEPQ